MKVTCQPKSVRTRKPGGQTPFGKTCELGPTAVSFGPRSDLDAAVSALAALPPPARTGPSRKVRRSYASSSSCGPTFEEPVEVSGDVAGEAAFDLAAGLAFGCAAGDVVAGGW